MTGLTAISANLSLNVKLLQPVSDGLPASCTLETFPGSGLLELDFAPSSAG